MQGHIIRRPKKKDLLFDTSDEDNDDAAKESHRQVGSTPLDSEGTDTG